MQNSHDELFDAMYQNAEMGKSAIRQIFPKVNDTRLKSELRRQLSNYRNEENEIMGVMYSSRIKPQPLSMMTKMMSKAGIAMDCARDKSSEHIAEMLIQGTNMGIININKALNHSVTSDPHLVREAKSMLQKEQDYIDRLKGYL